MITQFTAVKEPPCRLKMAFCVNAPSRADFISRSNIASLSDIRLLVRAIWRPRRSVRSNN